MDLVLLHRLFIITIVALFLSACSRSNDVVIPVAQVKPDVDCSIPEVEDPLVNSLSLETFGKDSRVLETILSSQDLRAINEEWMIRPPLFTDQILVTINLADRESKLTLVGGGEATITRIEASYEASDNLQVFRLEDEKSETVSWTSKTLASQIIVKYEYEVVEERSRCQLLGVEKGDDTGGDEELFIYRLVQDQFVLTFYPLPDDKSEVSSITTSGTGFGKSVSTNTEFIAVGSPLDDLNFKGFETIENPVYPSDSIDSGAVRLYRRSESGIANCGTLKPSNSRPGDHFGAQVLVRDDLLYVSAPFEDGGGSGVFVPVPSEADFFYDRPDSGAVYVYRLSSECSVTEVAYIKSPDNEINLVNPAAEFGYSLTEFEGSVFVGAPRQANSSNAAIVDGAVYMFIKDEESWQNGQRLVSEVKHDNEGFGTAISAQEGYLYVGSPGDALDVSDLNNDDGSVNNDGSVDIQVIIDRSYLPLKPNSGAVHVFKQELNGSFQPMRYIKPSNSDEGDRFGSFVDAVTGKVFISAPYEDSNSNVMNTAMSNNLLENSGAVYEYQLEAGEEITLKNYIKSHEPAEQAKFGTVFRVARRYLAVGDSRANTLVSSVKGHVELIDYTTYEDPRYISVFEDPLTNSPLDAPVEAMDLYGGVLVLGLPKATINGVNQSGAFAVWE